MNPLNQKDLGISLPFKVMQEKGLFVSKKIFKIVFLFVVVGFCFGVVHACLMPEKPDLSGPLVPGGSPRLRGYHAKAVREATEKYQSELRTAKKRFAVLEDCMWASFSVAAALSIVGSISLFVESRERKKYPIYHW